MTGIANLKAPLECTEEERQEFAQLVRQGFPGAADLDRRIRDAKWLAFHYTADHTLVGVAALKAPSGRYREDVFRQANAPVIAAEYEHELGWVFVTPAERGSRIGESLCGELLARVPTRPVFATTRSDNEFMIAILETLGFVRVGSPYPRRDEELVLFLRS